MNTLKEICRNSGDYLIALIPYLAHVIAESEITEEIRTLRWDGLCKLHGQLRRYEKRNSESTLLSSLAAKKAEQIVQARTKKEIEQIFNPHAPYFDGVKFVPDAYLVPEEELICWCEASLRAPLNEYGMRRYIEMFGQVFPEKSRELDL